MSASILNVESDIGQDIATNVAGITWQGSSSGGLWPGPEQPLGVNDIPGAGAVFIYVIARAPVKQAIRGGSSTGQMHEVTVRILAVSNHRDYATTYGLIQDAVGYAHSPTTLPTGYTDIRLVSGPFNQPAREGDEYARTYADLRVSYSED